MTAENSKPRPTRRQMLSRAAAAVGTGVAAQALPGALDSAAAAAPVNRPWGHAVGDPRGSDIAVTSGRGAEARFGLMFKKLPAFAPPDDLLLGLATQMTDPREPGTDPSTSDEFDNFAVPAGFTFLGQFIDHDMTRDTTPLTQQQADPKGLKNFDTPVFDLGSVYGAGPAVDKALYEPDGKRLKLRPSPDGVPDLPRAADGTAFVGDPRNDENHIVGQLQIAFIRLHNTLIAEGNSFETARRLTRWRFQWIIVNDYLPHVVGQPLVTSLLKKTSTAISYAGSLYKPKNPNRPMMPLEYAVAAFRFGHSMIRPEYEMHDGSIVKIFGTAGNDLRGSCPLTSEVEIDWNYFFEIPGMDPPDDRRPGRSRRPAPHHLAGGPQPASRQAAGHAVRTGRREGHRRDAADQRPARARRPSLGRQGAALVLRAEGGGAAAPGEVPGLGRRPDRRGDHPRHPVGGQVQLPQRRSHLAARARSVPDG